MSPALPTLALAPGSDTGVSHTDGITNDATPILTGTAAAGAAITLLDGDGTVRGTTRADAKGNFLLTSAALADGTHTLSVTQSVGGTTLTSAPLNLDVAQQATASSTAAAVPQTATDLTFTVHFDQPVSTVSATSFVLATTGTAYGNVEAVTGSGQDYTVSVAGLGGEGTVAVALSAFPVTDLAGNPVALTQSSSHPVADTTSPTTTLASSDQFGVAGTGNRPDISGGGRLIAFLSTDKALTPDQPTTPGIQNAYVKDLQTGAVVLVSNGFGAANGNTNLIEISADGTTVAFASAATNLVAGGTPDGALILYTAKLTSAASPEGLSLVPDSIRRIATLDSDVTQEGDLNSFSLSGDGSTLAFGTDAELPGAAGDADHDYIETLATGAVSQIPGAGNDAITSISYDGSVVAYQGPEAVPDTSGQPNLEFGGTLGPATVGDAFVYNAATTVTTTIDGSGLLPGTEPPTVGDQIADYDTLDPVLSGDGKTVVFQLARGANQDSLFSVNLATDTILPVSPGAGSGGGTDDDLSQSASFGGGIIAYQSDDPVNGETLQVYNAATRTTAVFGPGGSPVLSAQGNAIAFAGIADPSQTSFSVYELSSGVSASIAPIDGNDAVDASDLAQAQAAGLAVSGTTNAPAGSTVVLSVALAVSGAKSDPFPGTVGEDGQWTATIPANLLAFADGTFFLLVQVVGSTGASPQTSRLFTIDTAAPAAPTTPVLDQGSNSGKDGVNTRVATPTLDGLAEPGAFVTLYDTAGGTQTKLGTAIADQNGVYTVTSAPLSDGTHMLAVGAQDAAGNSSALSGKASVIVDTVAPQRPSAPVLEQAQDSGRDENAVGSDPAPELGGVAEPKASITLFDGLVALRTVAADADGAYLVTTPKLADGPHSLTVVATDAAGNQSQASDPLAIVVDTVAPAAPLLANVTGTTQSDGGLSPSFDVTGVSSANTVVTLLVDGVAVPADAAATRASGGYDIAVPFLAAGSHTLSVTATDQAGNVSAASAPTTVTITSIATAPAGTPPGAPVVNGVLEDGAIAGATVFADANGNGVLDAGEASAVTTPAGQFTLFGPAGALVATGGTDIVTGLTPPGRLTAPAGSSVITPLTTLLGAYLAARGGTLASAQAAVASALGLAPATDLTSLDPQQAAAGGDFSALVASAQVMDIAVACADVIATQTGVSSATAFAATFAALAAAAAAGPLQLQQSGSVQAVLAAAAAIAAPGATLPTAVLQGAGDIVSTGNVELGSYATPGNGNTSLGFVGAVERVEQGKAAPQFAAGAPNAEGIYTFGLGDQVSAAESPVLPAPALAPGQDTGLSAQDNITSILAPVFTGTAPPGATVLLAAAFPSATNLSYTVAGSGIANAGGLYSITAQLTPVDNAVVAIQAAPGQATAVGTPITVPNLPASNIAKVSVGNLALTQEPQPTIADVSYVASSANDATHTEIYVDGAGASASQADGTYTLTADGNPAPLGTSATNRFFGLVTSPLANGPHTLVVTDTFADGETLQSLPFSVTLTAPGSVTLNAQATGAVVGGSILSFGNSTTLSGLGGNDLNGDANTHPAGITDSTGTVTVPALFTAKSGGSTVSFDATQDSVELVGGQDALTGLPLPTDLVAPPGSAEISPVTTLVAAAIADADIGPAGPPKVTPAEISFETGRVAHDLGLPSTTPLLTTDPLATAEAGDPSLLLKDIELLDTVTLLAPFVPQPFTALDRSEQLFSFGATFVPPPVTNAPIDFTSAAALLALLMANRSSSTSVDASVLPQAAAIIAASNAAIEAHAKTATSLADALSYALAAERVAQGAEAQALATSTSFAAAVVGEQAADFTALQAADTGAGLAAAIAAALVQTVQVTSFTPLAASTGAATADFSLVFSAPVTGLTAANFAVSASPGLLRSAVSAVTPVAGSRGMAYTVAVSTGVGQGTLTLGFTPGGITGPGGAPLAGGAFAPIQTYASPSEEGSQTGTTSLLVRDFNGDGRPDIAEVAEGDNSVMLFLGQGDGTFVAQPAVYAGLLDPTDFVGGDFNGDGKLDIAALETGTDPAGLHDITVLPGNGDGTFGAPVQTALGTVPLQIAAGDFNGDGKLDLAVLSASPGGFGLDANVQLELGNGNGSFTAGPTIDIGDADYTDYTSSIVTADVNGDGKADLVVNTIGSMSRLSGVAVLLGNGQGGFTLATQTVLGATDSGPGSGGLIAVADLNGDGIPDIVELPTYPNAAADANGAIAPTLNVLLGRGDGTFQPATSVALPLPPVHANQVRTFADTEVGLAVGDVTGDGTPDIVVQNALDGDIVLPGTGAGSFGPGYFTTASQGNPGDGNVLALADVNGDGRPDLVTGSNGSSATNTLGDGIGVALNMAQAVLPASAAVTVARAAVASPVLTELGGGGTLAQNGNSYTLSLGSLAQGSSAAALFALANTAIAGSDAFDGTFQPPTGSGFTVTGASLPGPVLAGGSQGGLGFAADTGTVGSHSETITFAPRDATDDFPTTVSSTIAEQDPTGVLTAAADPAGADVSGELAPLTLTVDDTVVPSGTLAPAALTVAGTVALPNARVGAADTVALPITNSAASPAATLDIAAAATGAATVTGTVSGLQPGATDATDLVVGLSTTAAGAQAGTITLAPASDLAGAATPLTPVPVSVSGSVFRPAAGQTTPVSAILHVGDPGTVALAVGNGDPADGFSEALLATLASVTPGLTAAAAGPARIAPGTTGQSLALGVSTAAPGTITGTATLALSSDGVADGLGALALPSVTVPVAITVDAFAQAALTATGAALSGTAASGYTLDLGAVQQDSAPVGVMLATLNAAAGPADALAGSYTVSPAPGFTDSGFAAFSAQAAGQTDGGGTVTLQTGQPGTFSQTLVLHPNGSNASGYAAALPDQIVTVTGTVLPVGAPVTTPDTLTVTPGQGATPVGIAAPTDPNYAAATLAITVTALPSNGSVDLADGTTPITLGQVLGVAQLTGLTFLPATGASATQSRFGYSVADPAGGASAGSATLAIGAAAETGQVPAPPVLAPGNLLTDVPTPSISGTAAPGSLVTILLAGTAVATVSADASGAFQTTLGSPLPLGPDILTATVSTPGGTSAASAPVALFETPPLAGGVSTADASTRDVTDALGRPFGLELSPGTQAVQLLDGTISVAPGTNQGFQARLYEGLFGRAADPQAGYADDQMVKGLTHAQIATEFLATPEGRADFAGVSDTAFVSALATGFLGRPLSAAEQGTDLGLLASGTSRGALLQGVADSGEAQAHLAAATSDVFIPRPTAAAVYQMYETGLGRDGELAGLQYATNEVLTGGFSLLQVAQQMATTPEFLADHAAQGNAAYVGTLWQDGLGRTMDTVGSALVAALNAGQTTRGDALFAVATTPEAAANLTRYLG